MLEAKPAEVAGKLFALPGSRGGGATRLMLRTAPPASLAQLVIMRVSTSAQAASLASQQLWPPPTLVTRRDAAGLPRSTMGPTSA